MNTTTDDLRITETTELLAPAQLINDVPVTAAAESTVTNARQAISSILAGTDDRLVVIVGPCSIHDPDAAREYAQKLIEYKNKHEKELCIVMRVYFEKPRTTIGWKGLINDPDMDNSFNINKGVKTARSLLADINEMGLPAGVEYLDLISPQFIADLVGGALLVLAQQKVRVTVN